MNNVKHCIGQLPLFGSIIPQTPTSFLHTLRARSQERPLSHLYDISQPWRCRIFVIWETKFPVWVLIVLIKCLYLQRPMGEIVGPDGVLPKPFTAKSGKFQTRQGIGQSTLILFVYIIPPYSHRCTVFRYMRQRGVIVSPFIVLKVFQIPAVRWTRKNPTLFLCSS